MMSLLVNPYRAAAFFVSSRRGLVGVVIRHRPCVACNPGLACPNLQTIIVADWRHGDSGVENDRATGVTSGAPAHGAPPARTAVDYDGGDGRKSEFASRPAAARPGRAGRRPPSPRHLALLAAGWGRAAAWRRRGGGSPDRARLSPRVALSTVGRSRQDETGREKNLPNAAATPPKSTRGIAPHL